MPYISPITAHSRGKSSPFQTYSVTRPSLRLLAAGFGLLHCLTGCADEDFDSLGGKPLGEPLSVVYGIDSDSGAIMVVLSSLPNVCQLIQSLQPPKSDDYWFITWSDFSGLSPYAKTQEDDQTRTFIGTSETVDYDINCPFMDWLAHDPNECVLHGKLQLTFDSGDQVSGEIEASYCNADMFNGL